MTHRCPCPRCQSDRLGDYYAGLTNNDWLNLVREHSRLKALVVAHGLVAIAHHTFRSGSSLSAQMTALDFAKASDAFAHGALKYGRVGDWRNVPLDHHMQAAGRHFDAWRNDHASTDAESGLTHEAHFLARAVMIQEIRRTR